VRSILFDLDGTLADTAPDLALALNAVLKHHGRTPLSYEAIRPVASHGGIALIELGFQITAAAPEFEQLRQEFLDYYHKNICQKTSLFEGMEQVLEYIESNNMNWGIVTNKPAFLTDPLIAALGLSSRAVSIISGDTANNRKPHPEPILLACQQAGSTPDQCLYVGDAQRDIEAGHHAGMLTAVANWGYIGHDDKPDNWGADLYFDQPADLMDWLNQ
jgi:phosphoglycolate phosphatase